MFGSLNLRPINNAKGQIDNFQTVSPFTGTTPINGGKKQRSRRPILFWLPFSLL
jgi:hypothetical protein